MQSRQIEKTEDLPMKLFQQCLVFLSVVTLLQLLVFLGLIGLTLQAEREADAASYSNSVITKATSISRGLQDWVSSIVLFLGTKDRKWIDRFTRLSEELPKDLANLEENVPTGSNDYKDLKLARQHLE
jgi:hypothetical protein